MNEQITKKQHFVPAFYLKQFADSDNFLQTLNLLHKRIGKNTYSSVCWEEYFYAQQTGVQDQISQEIEKAFRILETQIASELGGICSVIRNPNKPITGKEKIVLSCLISMLYLRGKYMRYQVNEMKESIGREVLKFIKTRREPSEEERNTYSEFGNSLHLSMLSEISDFSRWFFIKKWKIYISKMTYHFITSDNPVTEIFPKERGLLGPHICERIHYLALAPDILIELTEPRGNNKIKRVTIFPEKNDLMLYLNVIRANEAEQYIYSLTKIELEKLLIDAPSIS